MIKSAERVMPTTELFDLSGRVAVVTGGNGGITVVAGVLEQTPEDWDKVIETNLNACFLLSKLAAQSMVKRREGKIINIASMFSFFGSGTVPSYSAAKGALVQLTKSMAIELAPFNIQVNAIAPGRIDTHMVAPMKTTRIYERIIARTRSVAWASPTNAPEPLFIWRPERPILSRALPSALTAVMRFADANQSCPIWSNQGDLAASQF
jgi:NAD(P)-dependent dehydrogenase (short-subunit alcohol dehydrogenase family)